MLFRRNTFELFNSRSQPNVSVNFAAVSIMLTRPVRSISSEETHAQQIRTHAEIIINMLTLI